MTNDDIDLNTKLCQKLEDFMEKCWDKIDYKRYNLENTLKISENYLINKIM